MSFLPDITGSFSTGAAHNPTVAMMDAAFAELHGDWRYVNCEVSSNDLAAAVAGAWAMGWKGFNCSMPHKQAVIPFLEDLSDSARICNAVNCITRTETGWTGHNTDGVGFADSLDGTTEIGGSSALILGAGGAAHAIATELALRGAARISISSRSTQAVDDLCQLVNERTEAFATPVAWTEEAVSGVEARLVVNATPIGSVGAAARLPISAWPSATEVVADVVITTERTPLLAAAHADGLAVIDGSGMLVNQAIENVRLWTGERPDRVVVANALRQAL